MDISRTKLKVRTIPTRLICGADDKLSSIIDRFPNTHTPLFAYDENKNSIGLLTVHGALFTRRYNPSTLISSCLVNPPKLLPNTPANEILRVMSNLKLYTLPVFDEEGKITGVVTAKTILKDLMKKQLFAEEMVENVPKRAVITIAKESDTGDAFQLFSKYALSRLVAVDANNKIVGVVTKRDILSLYLAPTRHQRFSTRSSQTNYSFDIEKIKRDRKPLMKYISPIANTLDEKTDTYTAIVTLLNSKKNSVILVNNEHEPKAILTLRDVLKTAVRITTKTPYLLTVVSELPEEINQAEKKEVNRGLVAIAAWFNKREKVQLVRFTTKIVFSSEEKPNLFIVKLKINTDASSHIAENKDRDFLAAFREVINQIKKQLRRKH